MAIKIIADSVADIPQDLAKALNITVLPLTVNFEDGSYRDGVDLTHAEFFQKLRAATKLPTTSQVPPGVFLETFEHIVDAGDDIIGIFMSSKLSGTYQAACAAREMLGRGRITIIDSTFITFPTGQIALALAQMVNAGMSYDTLVQKAHHMIEKSNCRFIVDTLEYLTKGGRLKPAEALVGNLLNIKPILTMSDGELKSHSKARGRKKAIKLVLDDLESKGVDLNDKLVAFFDAADKQYLDEFYQQVKLRYPRIEPVFAEVGCVVGTHSGPSCIAISYIDIPKSELFNS